MGFSEQDVYDNGGEWTAAELAALFTAKVGAGRPAGKTGEKVAISRAVTVLGT